MTIAAVDCDSGERAELLRVVASCCELLRVVAGGGKGFLFPLPMAEHMATARRRHHVTYVNSNNLVRYGRSYVYYAHHVSRALCGRGEDADSSLLRLVRLRVSSYFTIRL